jgi:hypothetical protein
MTTTRRARLETWQPSKQITRVLKTRQIAFSGDPADLIARAARLAAGRPIGIDLATCSEDAHSRLGISFGTDRRGIQTSVYVRLKQSDVPAMMRYLERQGGIFHGFMFCDYPDDDGGLELPVPPTSVHELAQHELAQLETTATVQ